MVAYPYITWSKLNDVGMYGVCEGDLHSTMTQILVTGTVDSDRGCRSQIRTRVKDAEKWLQAFTAGLHRLIFYGDHTRALERMGRLLGFEVVQEM
jgi:hypothetical protein